MEKERFVSVDKDTRVVIEDSNYTLQSRVLESTSKNTRKHWRTEGYFPDMVSALQSWSKDAPARLDRVELTFQQVIDSWKRCEKRIEELIKK